MGPRPSATAAPWRKPLTSFLTHVCPRPVPSVSGPTGASGSLEEGFSVSVGGVYTRASLCLLLKVSVSASNTVLLTVLVATLLKHRILCILRRFLIGTASECASSWIYLGRCAPPLACGITALCHPGCLGEASGRGAVFLAFVRQLWPTVDLARDGRPVTASPAPQRVPEKEPEFNITGSSSRGDDKAHD